MTKEHQHGYRSDCPVHGTDAVRAMRETRKAAEKHGLYRSATESDACGVGFVVNMRGERSHDIIEKGLQILRNLDAPRRLRLRPADRRRRRHPDADPARVLRARVRRRSASRCRAAGEYGVGMVFLPRDVHERNECLEIFEKVVREEGQRILGWRDVPVDPSTHGPARARVDAGDPAGLHRAGPRRQGPRRARAQALRDPQARRERGARLATCATPESFYVPSLSTRTIVYKGLLLPDQIPAFYPT